MSKLAERTDIPALEGGWINLTEASEILGVTRSYIYKLAAKPQALVTLRRVGKQPSFVVNLSEIENLLAAQSEKAEPVEVSEDSEVESAKADVLSIEDLLAEMP